MNQKGFATLEVILMVVVLGILATVAVPRFTDITTKANTAKIQADLATLNSAMAVYEMEKGELPASPKVLADDGYIVAEPVAPESGKIYIKKTGADSTADVSGKQYDIDTTKKQAKFGDFFIEDIGKKSST